MRVLNFEQSMYCRPASKANHVATKDSRVRWRLGQVLIVQGHHGRKCKVAMLGSIQNKRTLLALMIRCCVGTLILSRQVHMTSLSRSCPDTAAVVVHTCWQAVLVQVLLEIKDTRRPRTLR